MKHLLRDLIIFGLSVSGIALLYRRIQRKRGPLVRAICFHNVADRHWFSDVMDLLVNKYNVVTPEQFHNKEFTEDKINILITFDDGYQTWIDNCLPELDSRGLKALFFVNSGLLDITNDEAKTTEFYRNKLFISPKLPLTWEGVRQLKAAGHTVGTHTVNHIRMAQVSGEEAREELLNDKSRHEEMLDIKITDFAYPFGTSKDYSEDTIQLVKDAGLTHQFSAITGFVNINDMSHIIPRTLIENNQSLGSISRWLSGSYDVFKTIQN